MRGMGGIMSAPLRGMGGLQDEPMGSGVLAGPIKKFRAPFVLSGSFSDATLDGWTTAGAAYTTFAARTAPGCMLVSGNLLNRSSLNVPAEKARNCRFTFSVWHKHKFGTSSADTSRALRYTFGGGNEANLLLVQDSSSTWRQMVGTFDNTEDRDVLFSLFGSCNGGSFEVQFDDWRIEGIPLESIPPA